MAPEAKTNSAQWEPDVDKFFDFVYGNQFSQLANKACVLVVGRMGSGKSTTISVQMGAKVKLEHGESGPLLKIVWSDTYLPRTSHGHTSNTLNMGLYNTPDSRLLVDTAGLDEGRGPNEALWTTWNMSITFKLLRCLEAVVVCIDYSEAFGGRGDSLKQLADTVADKVAGRSRQSQSLYDAMVFVFTKPFDSGTKVTEKQVLHKVKAMLAEEEGNLKKWMSDARRQYGTCLNPLDSNNTLGELNWDKVPKEQSDKHASHDALICLLKAIESAQDRRFISYPESPAACLMQRKEVQLMICRSVSKTGGLGPQKLQAISSARGARSLEVYDTLAKMIGQPRDDQRTLLGIATEKARLLEAMVKQFDDPETRQLLMMGTSQTNSWATLKKHIVAARENQVIVMGIEITDYTAEISRLTSSETEKLFHVEEVRQFRYGLSLANLGWRDKTCTFAPGRYEEYTLTEVNDNKFTSTDVDANKESGELKIRLVSYMGHDLIANVNFFRMEKDMPSTHTRIKTLDSLIAQRGQTLAKLRAQLQLLQHTKSFSELGDVLCDQKKKLEEDYQNLCAETEGHNKSSAALVDMLNTLQQTKAFPVGFAKLPSHSTIEDFLSKQHLAKAMSDKLNSMDVVKNMISLRPPVETHIPMREDAAPQNWQNSAAALVESLRSNPRIMALLAICFFILAVALMKGRSYFGISNHSVDL